MDEWMDGSMDGKTYGWIERWTERWKPKHEFIGPPLLGVKKTLNVASIKK